MAALAACVSCCIAVPAFELVSHFLSAPPAHSRRRAELLPEVLLLNLAFVAVARPQQFVETYVTCCVHAGDEDDGPIAAVIAVAICLMLWGIAAIAAAWGRTVSPCRYLCTEQGGGAVGGVVVTLAVLATFWSWFTNLFASHASDSTYCWLRVPAAGLGGVDALLWFVLVPLFLCALLRRNNPHMGLSLDVCLHHVALFLAGCLRSGPALPTLLAQAVLWGLMLFSVWKDGSGFLLIVRPTAAVQLVSPRLPRPTFAAPNTHVTILGRDRG